MEYLQTMFDFLPVMIDGVVAFVEWCMTYSVSDAITTLSVALVAINPALSVTVSPALIGFTAYFRDNPLLDLPFFVFMFGAGFVLYALGSFIRWLLDIIT